ncbi:MAG: putative bifunctional diguanylate cyclase/phosphodiesterase [Desulfococcaceae bacterium]
MYEAKKQRKGYRFFTRRMNRRALDRITLEKELRTAMQNDQFVMFYQPITDQQEITRGMESLIRWMHPSKGITPPGVFISVLEDMGEILSIGRWVLYRSCMEVKTWNQRYGTDLFVSVNVSALQLQDDLFVHTVEDALHRSGLPPALLKLEITESTIMKDPESVMEKIKILQARGVEFSIDDFGTGYSSLSYLRKLPFNTLKIDRSFVEDAVACHETREIIKTIIAMSKALQKKILAEGIETAEQKDLLKQLGCNLLQGYFFNKPMPAAAFEREIIRWQTSN